MPIITSTTTTPMPWSFYLIDRYGSKICESFYGIPKSQGVNFFVMAGPFNNWMDCMKTDPN